MVDDSSADRTLCRLLLQEEYGAELEFVEASDARRGLELCEQRPDCLLLDYKLPDLTGVEFLRRLDPPPYASVDLPEFAVVMLTGLGNEQVAAEAMRAGAQDYLVKDRITSESLRLAIEKATGKVGLLRALQSERDRLAAMLAEKETLLTEKEALLTEKEEFLAEKEGLILEKDALLQEVQHRVKNNLQVIASLLRLQAESFGDARLEAALRESQHRVESMALIHEQLYEARNLREVDLAEHAELLARHLMHAYGANGQARIQYCVTVEKLPVSVNRAIPAALILNELISNALKHAFPQNRSGLIEVTGGHSDRGIYLQVADNGEGLKADQETKQTLGLDIVRILTRQLSGTFSIKSMSSVKSGDFVKPASSIKNVGRGGNRGTICRLTFPAQGEQEGTAHASQKLPIKIKSKFFQSSAG